VTSASGVAGACPGEGTNVFFYFEVLLASGGTGHGCLVCEMNDVGLGGSILSCLVGSILSLVFCEKIFYST
jgi:hypothetical protein